MDPLEDVAGGWPSAGRPGAPPPKFAALRNRDCRPYLFGAALAMMADNIRRTLVSRPQRRGAVRRYARGGVYALRDRRSLPPGSPGASRPGQAWLRR